MPNRKGRRANIISLPIQDRKESSGHNSRQPTPPTINQDTEAKPATTNAPLAPPPRPNQNAGGDYFNTDHNKNSSVLREEPNPFEAQFGNPSSETPGKGLLPPIANLTSPSSLIQGNTPGWPNSLRSGPLSPAMLPGPTGQSDYFDPSFRGSFPTPNESSLRTGLTPGDRTGLTPGGGGSMFPMPSPGSSSLLFGLNSGGATPGTLEFHRTALSAKASNNQHQNQNTSNNAPTSQPLDQNGRAMDQRQYQAQQSQQSGQQDPFGHQDGNDAANGLLFLARNNGQNYNMGQQPNNPQVQTNMQMGQAGGQSQGTSPRTKRASKNSMSISGDNGDGSESGSEQAKPSTRSRGKKATTNGKAQTGNRRKAEEPPARAPANKRGKNNNGSISAASLEPDENDSDMEGSIKGEEDGMLNGKKMTDEEKRKNFLERNRVAALKCRQRKKQWLANLQTKVEIYSTENDALTQTVASLREEVVNLKTLLMAHKDCPIAQQQGIGNMIHNYPDMNGGPQHANPYGMAMAPNGVMPPGMGQMQGQGPPGQMQRG
ncbi:hypothetical protein K402DRAFT_414759 [Aulographum hederae CBS 113979]|uniref:BZIP domain-containing protein n=1 Tax=Aulographum hederae CBS 113979 TaxID=1176131 RepID=A0A6G1GP49_9PEZI|nr:hypothetical protein K402DRAFT_414759 [Aulographum hederae CBS 113979]